MELSEAVLKKVYQELQAVKKEVKVGAVDDYLLSVPKADSHNSHREAWEDIVVNTKTTLSPEFLDAFDHLVDWRLVVECHPCTEAQIERNLNSILSWAESVYYLVYHQKLSKKFFAKHREALNRGLAEWYDEIDEKEEEREYLSSTGKRTVKKYKAVQIL